MSLNRWLPAVVGLVLLAAWWAATAGGFVVPALLPSPQATVARLISGFEQGYLATSTWITFKIAALGCLTAGVIGIPLGWVLAKSRHVARLVEPYLAASQAMPAIAIAPLLVLWVGYGTVPVVILCTIIVIFPIVISTTVGIRSVDPDIAGAARLDGASGIIFVTAIEFPLAAPMIVAGIRTGFTLSITGAVVGEMVIGGNGLGMQLLSAQGAHDTTGMFATITVLAILAISVYAALRWIENRIVIATE